MASSKEYSDYILEQLPTSGVTYRAMMGEYLIYYHGKLIGGIYDDRFLVKPTTKVAVLLPDAPKEIPYEGAKEMLLIEDVDDRAFLQTLLTALYEDLPAPKKK